MDDERVWAAGYGGGPGGRWADVAAATGRAGARRTSDAPALARRTSCGWPPTPTSVRPGTVVGTSSLAEWDLENEGVHLGWTAYGPRWWGTSVNPACKLALLSHAFDDCGFGRVKLQTDLINARSQAAMLKLGATREGVVRRDIRRADGSWRDSVLFSILVRRVARGAGRPRGPAALGAAYRPRGAARGRRRRGAAGPTTSAGGRPPAGRRPRPRPRPPYRRCRHRSGRRPRPAQLPASAVKPRPAASKTRTARVIRPTCGWKRNTITAQPAADGRDRRDHHDADDVELAQHRGQRARQREDEHAAQVQHEGQRGRGLPDSVGSPILAAMTDLAAAPRPGHRRPRLRARPRARLPLLVGPGADQADGGRRRAQGSHVWDYDGNRYLDFSSQLVNINIGHQHPKVVAAIQEQAARLCTIAPQHANDQRSEAARLIVERRARAG